METLRKTKTLKVEFHTAKVIESKRDGRLAVVKEFGDLRTTLWMERIGERNFSNETINKGFNPLCKNEDVVIRYFQNNYSPRNLFNPKKLYETSFEIYDVLSEILDGLTNYGIAKILENYVKKIDEIGDL